VTGDRSVPLQLVFWYANACRCSPLHSRRCRLYSVCAGDRNRMMFSVLLQSPVSTCMHSAWCPMLKVPAACCCHTRPPAVQAHPGAAPAAARGQRVPVRHERHQQEADAAGPVPVCAGAHCAHLSHHLHSRWVVVGPWDQGQGSGLDWGCLQVHMQRLCWAQSVWASEHSPGASACMLHL
jgi:hypothetical protein